MTKDQFVALYRCRLLGFLAECYAARRTTPSEFGMEVDRHFIGINKMLNGMWEDLHPPQQPPTNGKAQPQVKNEQQAERRN